MTPENRRPKGKGCKLCHREQERARYAANPAAHRAASLKRQRRSRPAVNARIRAWRRANADRERARAREHRRRERGGSNGGDDAAYAAVLAGDPCAYCGEASEHVDHVVPVSAGGDSRWENLTASCAFCNQSKGARPLLAFLARRA